VTVTTPCHSILRSVVASGRVAGVAICCARFLLKLLLVGEVDLMASTDRESVEASNFGPYSREHSNGRCDKSYTLAERLRA
jgi:hypothetical protein